MKLTKNQLKRIIKEELNRENEGLFSDYYMYDMIKEEVENYLNKGGGAPGLTRTELDMIRSAIMGAFEMIKDHYELN